MPERVQRVGMSASALQTFKGLAREIIVDTTNNVATVHDGVTPGGVAQARADLANVPDATASSAGKMTTVQVAELAAAAVNASNVAGTLTRRYFSCQLSESFLTIGNGQDIIWDAASNKTAVNGDWLTGGNSSNLIAPYTGYVHIHAQVGHQPSAGYAQEGFTFSIELNGADVVRQDMIYNSTPGNLHLNLQYIGPVTSGDIFAIKHNPWDAFLPVTNCLVTRPWTKFNALAIPGV